MISRSRRENPSFFGAFDTMPKIWHHWFGLSTGRRDFAATRENPDDHVMPAV
jgi:hypothetical protein